MKGSQGNGFLPIIAQAIAEMEETHGEFKNLDEINLAELSRLTGLSRAKLRRLKENGFCEMPHGLRGQRKEQILDGYSSVLDSMLRGGVSNSAVCLERLQEMGFTGSRSTVKRYIAAYKHLIRDPLEQTDVLIVAYQFRSYIVKDREYFEYGEVDPKLEQITGRKLPITKTDLPLMESLIGFFYLDREELAAICKRISTALRAYRPNEDFETFRTIRTGLEELSGKHLFFKLLELDWRDLLHQADLHPESFRDYLPIKEIEELPSEVAERQQRMEELFSCVMEFGLDRRTVAERMADFSSVKVLQDEKTFPFSKLTVGYEWVSVAAVTEVLYPESVFDLVDFYLRECIRREIPLRRCKSCGRLKS